MYETAVKAFEDANDNIRVKLIKVADGDDHLAKLTTTFAGGHPPDVFLINYREYAQFVTRGAVAEVDSLADGRIDFDLYYEQPLDAFTFDGAIQCMPQNISSLVVYNNTDLFKQAGISRPRQASDAYCIAAGSDNKEAALEFIRFITGQQGQTLTAFGGRIVPSLRSVAESGAFLVPTQEPRHSEVFLEGVPLIRRTPVISTWPEIESVSEELLTRLFYEDGYSVDDFLRDLKDQTDPLFAEAAQG